MYLSLFGARKENAAERGPAALLYRETLGVY